MWWGNDTGQAESATRPPAVAGYFYPEDADELRGEVDRYLEQAAPTTTQGKVLALISPHAGYQYSGPVAAFSYRRLQGQEVRRAVVISPCHVEAFEGCAVFPGENYQTPLGSLPVDRDFASILAARSGAEYSTAGHRIIGRRGEHALEVQLPFLQRTVGAVPIVPIVMGRQDTSTVVRLAFALEGLLDEGTILIASSDLSHHHPNAQARRLDGTIVSAVANFDYLLLESLVESDQGEACGAGPIQAVMIAAQRAGANGSEILKYATSGDVPPFRTDAVVGYLAAALTRVDGRPPAGQSGLDLTREEEELALHLVRTSIAAALQRRKTPEIPSLPEIFSKPAAVFVTLHKAGRLRGCIGSIQARDSLDTSIRASAVNAAFQDPRFPPVEEEELEHLSCEISILSPFRLIRRPDEISVGRDGLMIRQHLRRGLLLPQVAVEQDWDAVTFLGQTCRKAGLPIDTWRDPSALIYAFSARVIEEEEAKGSL